MKSMLLSIAVFGYLHSFTQVEGLFPGKPKQYKRLAESTESIEDRPLPKYPEKIVEFTIDYKGETPLPEKANDFKSAYLYVACFHFVLERIYERYEKFTDNYLDLVHGKGEVKTMWNEEMNLLDYIKRSADASYSEIANLKYTLGRLGSMSKRKKERLQLAKKKPGLLKRALRSMKNRRIQSKMSLDVYRWSIKNGDIVETPTTVKVTKPIVNAPKKIKDKKIPKNWPAVAFTPKTLTLKGRSSYSELDAFREALWKLLGAIGDTLKYIYIEEDVLSTDEKVEVLKSIMWQSGARLKDLDNVKLHLKQIIDFTKEDLETRTALYKKTYPNMDWDALTRERGRNIILYSAKGKITLHDTDEPDAQEANGD